ncbi:MAG: PP2C family serine/threonine-protein phosphatase [Acutalibacteraceae bacterium]
MTVIGASHIKNGTVCQDCSQSCEKTECRLVVVCDGHGGADYFRSDRGSKLAAASFMDCMENPDLIAALSAAATEKQRKSRIEQLIKSIIARWNSLVEQDMRQHPFDEDELSGVSEKARRRYEAGERLQAAYGTTLIGAVLAEDFWLGLQIGDGKCVVVSETGEFTQPIPWDEECFLNVTTSLCDENAAKEFRFCFSRTLPAAVFIGSDGIDDCFAGDERLYDFYRVTLKSFAQTDEETAVAQLKEYLPTLSEKGSGDDMSVGILVNTDLVCKSESVYRK